MWSDTITITLSVNQIAQICAALDVAQAHTHQLISLTPEAYRDEDTAREMHQRAQAWQGLIFELGKQVEKCRETEEVKMSEQERQAALELVALMVRNGAVCKIPLAPYTLYYHVPTRGWIVLQERIHEPAVIIYTGSLAGGVAAMKEAVQDEQ